MKVLRYYDIQCDNCGRFRSTDYCAGMETNLNRVKVLAEREGWTSVRGNGNLCPVCSGKLTVLEFIRKYQSV